MVDLSSVEDYLYTAWIYMAMTNYPYEANFLEPLPANPVKVVRRFTIIAFHIHINVKRCCSCYNSEMKCPNGKNLLKISQNYAYFC